LGLDKCTIKFFADVLYLKGILCYEEHEAIMEIKGASDMDVVFERMMGEGFNAYKKGESYIKHVATGVRIDGTKS